MNRYRAIQCLLARGDYQVTEEKLAEVMRQSTRELPKMRSIRIEHDAKVRSLDWGVFSGCREMRNMASDTAKMCHPIIAPMRGDKPFRGDRVPKTMNYCSDDTYGMPVV